MLLHQPKLKLTSWLTMLSAIWFVLKMVNSLWGMGVNPERLGGDWDGWKPVEGRFEMRIQSGNTESVRALDAPGAELEPHTITTGDSL